MLGIAIVLVAIGANGAGGTAEAWVKNGVAVVVGMGVVLLVFRPGRWYDKPSR